MAVLSDMPPAGWGRAGATSLTACGLECPQCLADHMTRVVCGLGYEALPLRTGVVFH